MAGAALDSSIAEPTPVGRADLSWIGVLGLESRLEPRPRRLVAQDKAPSRLRPAFESLRGHN